MGVNRDYISAQLQGTGWDLDCYPAYPAQLQLRTYEGQTTNWLSIDAQAQSEIGHALRKMAARKDRQEGAT